MRVVWTMVLHRKSRAERPQKGDRAMTEEKQSYQRTRLYVDTRVQGTLVRQLILHWLLACSLIVLYVFTMQAFSNGFELGFMENLAIVWKRYGVLGMFMLVLSPVFIYDAIRLSNRYAGPMVSFRSALHKLATGENPEPISFRQDDFWKDLSRDLNRIADELRELRGEQEQTEDTDVSVGQPG